MGIKFKCKQSGNIFEYFTDHDIKTMRAHSEYTELQPIETEEVELKQKQTSQKRTYNKANKEE